MHEPPRKSSSLGLPVNIDKSVALAIPVASPPPPLAKLIVLPEAVVAVAAVVKASKRQM